MLTNPTNNSPPPPWTKQHPQAPMVNYICRIKGSTDSGCDLYHCHLQQIPGGTGSSPIKDREVCASILSLPYFAKYVDQCHTPVVHRLNREDKREIFSIPTCHFGDANKLSILMDDSYRTVLLIKRKKDENTYRSTPLEV